MKHKILIVDDEEDILEFVGYNLKKEDYEVLTAENGKDAVEIAQKELPDLIVLDVMMPIMDGIEACKRMREIESLQQTLIMFLTAREEDYMEIEGLESGADDYINKPIRPRLLVSKINALLRRMPEQGNSGDILKVSDLVVNKEQYSVTKSGQSLNLPRKEFEMLFLLISKPGKVFSRVEILAEIWGEDIFVTDRTVDVHIRKLREKVGEHLIKTIKGVGYKFED